MMLANTTINRMALLLLVLEVTIATPLVIDLGKASGVSPPAISSVTPIAAIARQTITIDGSGFGSGPGTTPLADGSINTNGCNAATPYLAIDDLGASIPWEAGRQKCFDRDLIGIFLISWSDTQIVLGGFGGALGGYWNISPGDKMVISVWGPSSSGNASYSLYAIAPPMQNPNPPTVSPPGPWQTAAPLGYTLVAGIVIVGVGYFVIRASRSGPTSGSSREGTTHYRKVNSSQDTISSSDHGDAIREEANREREFFQKELRREYFSNQDAQRDRDRDRENDRRRNDY